jgi:hypothetical protein
MRRLKRTFPELGVGAILLVVGVNILLSLALLAGAVFVVVKVLQWTGVL